MSDFDLIPPAYRQQMQIGQTVMLIARIGVGALLLMAIVWTGLQVAVGALNSEVQVLQQHNDKLNADKARFAQLEVDARALQSQRQQLLTLSAGGDIAELLLALDRALLPDTVQLTELRLQRPEETEIARGGANGVIGLRGFALSHTTLSEFVTRLVNQAAFVEMKLMRAERNNEEAAADAPLEFMIRGSTIATAGAAP